MKNWIIFLLPFFTAKALNIQPSLLRSITQDLYHIYFTIQHASMHVTVDRQLVESGFHRKLLTEVTIPDDLWFSDAASFVIIENVTNDIYVDVDQLSMLQSSSGELQVIVSEHMDTEKPAAASTSHVLLVYPILRDRRLTVELPIHLRYQAPCDSQYIPVTIPPPLMLCTFPPTQEGTSQQQSNTVLLPCNSTTSELCDWYPVAYKNVGNDYCTEEHCTHDRSLLALIPCGAKENVLFVVGLTIVITLFASLYVCKTIISVS